MATAGRILISLCNLTYSAGAFIADYNETHVLNPRWPPHAKFHNGQTMSLGVLLSASSMYFLLRPASSTEQARDNIFTAAMLASFYSAAALSAILYPGTAWADPEFEQGGEQRYIFSAVCILVWVGYWLERQRLEKPKKV